MKTKKVILMENYRRENQLSNETDELVRLYSADLMKKYYSIKARRLNEHGSKEIP